MEGRAMKVNLIVLVKDSNTRIVDMIQLFNEPKSRFKTRFVPGDGKDVEAALIVTEEGADPSKT